MLHVRHLAAAVVQIPVFVALAGCAGQRPDPVPAHATFTMQSSAVGEQRRINVYTPRAYAAAGTDRFPVLYMPDGGIEEDFPHIASTIEALIDAGTIPPMLVVGIENTERRRDLTGPTTVASDREIAPRVSGSARFRAFIRDELVPEIERRYRCNAQRAIVGESLAGLFVVETLLSEPKLFDRYIAVSPSLWWNGGALVHDAAQHLAAAEGLDLRLFLTSADEADIIKTTGELAGLLTQHAPKTLAWVYEPMPTEHHDTIFRAAKVKAFERVLGK
ncbi:MAG: alpha/beta hydrolase-fold protein [Planctomycetota bacterium]